MTKEEREQSLTNARLAAEWLDKYAPMHNQLACLLAEFRRLDAGEQARIEAGRKSGHLGAEYGKRGGRPKKPTASDR